MERAPPAAARHSGDGSDSQTLVSDGSHRHPPRRSVFDVVSAAATSRGSRVRCAVVAVSVPLIVILAFFAADAGRLFRGDVGDGVRLPPAAWDGSSSSSSRESELRTLLLLRNQRAGLISLYNATAAPSPAVDTLRSALLEQININNELQNALLSAHSVGSGNAPVGSCGKAERAKGRRSIEWNSQKHKFLLAICVSGQMSDRLICLEKHMFFAALLGRTLVLPSRHFDYQYSRMLDLEHINQCFGQKVVVSFEEFEEMRKKMKKRLRIDKFICYMASPPCSLSEEHNKKLKRLGVSFGPVETAFPEDAKLSEPRKRVVADIMPKFSSEVEVLAIGDMFYADVEDEWVMQPGGPLVHKCKTVFQPSRIIMLTAQRFVQTYLGGNFVALHFRRHGFLKLCNMKKDSCFFPIPQAADCILRVAARANSAVIYLSTDAADSETNLLQSLLPIPLIKRPSHTSAEKWDALLYRHHLAGDAQVEAMLDKAICALSNVFIGTPGSTFTDDILRLRQGWESSSRCDELLCQGEHPSYIAELDIFVPTKSARVLLSLHFLLQFEGHVKQSKHRTLRETHELREVGESPDSNGDQTDGAAALLSAEPAGEVDA